MAYFKIFQHCGTSLDHGERCDCIDAQYAALTPEHKKMVNDKINVLLIGQKNTALGVGSTRGGEAEQISKPVSISSITENQGERQV